MVCGPHAEPLRDNDTKEIIKFKSTQDVIEAAVMLGYNYWWPGDTTKPTDKIAYECLISKHFD